MYAFYEHNPSSLWIDLTAFWINYKLELTHSKGTYTREREGGEREKREREREREGERGRERERMIRVESFYYYKLFTQLICRT